MVTATLAGTIARAAFREGNQLGELDYPTPTQGREAMRQLNSIFATIYGTDAGERLADWPLGSYGRAASTPALPWTLDQLGRPPLNVRLIAANAAAMTVYLPPCPQDGARVGIVDPYSRLATVPVTIDGNGRPIEDAPSLVIDDNATVAEWFYRADLGEWLRISNVGAGDPMPFPVEYDPMFTILLAMRINPRYGAQLDEQSVATVKSLRGEFISRYLQSQPLDRDSSLSWPFMSRQGYTSQTGYSSTAAFNRGSDFGGC